VTIYYQDDAVRLIHGKFEDHIGDLRGDLIVADSRVTVSHRTAPVGAGNTPEGLTRHPFTAGRRAAQW